jgi:hypothetical protein
MSNIMSIGININLGTPHHNVFMFLKVGITFEVITLAQIHIDKNNTTGLPEESYPI